MIKMGDNKQEHTAQEGRGCGLYRTYLKRILDIVLTSAALVVFCWLYGILALMLRINMGKPVLFKTERIGKDGKPIMIYKFRTMTNEVDEKGILLPGPERLTRFGRFLRSTSLDELPSAWNIIKGDLSIVGPRPLPTKYRPYFYEYERMRHNVRPGLTGWAQVNGRNAISWDEKFKYDIDYVNNISLLFDVRVVLLTVAKVIMRSDIIQDDQMTASLYIVRADMNSGKGCSAAAEDAPKVWKGNKDGKFESKKASGNQQ